MEGDTKGTELKLGVVLLCSFEDEIFSTKLAGPLYGLFQFSLTPLDLLMSVGFYDY